MQREAGEREAQDEQRERTGLRERTAMDPSSASGAALGPAAAIPATDWPLAGSGSRWSDATTCAVLVIEPVWPTRTVIVSVAEPPFAMLPTVHAPVVELYVPPALLTYVTPSGSWSRTMTFDAGSGPKLVTTSV